MERRYYLDQPYATEIATLLTLQSHLRILASLRYTPLPGRLRRQFAGMVVRLTKIRRELERHPEQVAAERAAEDEAP